MLDAIHFELLAREPGSGRTPVEARRADCYLKHLLEEFLDRRELTGGPPETVLDPATPAERARGDRAGEVAIAFAGEPDPAQPNAAAGDRVPDRSLIRDERRRRHA